MTAKAPRAPSKAAQLKTERAARKQARAAAKAKEAAELADLKQRAHQLCQRMPPQFQNWGVTKTRAYTKMMAIVRHKAALKTIKRKRLASYVERMEQSDSWSMEYCQQLSMLSDTAVDVSCQDDGR